MQLDTTHDFLNHDAGSKLIFLEATEDFIQDSYDDSLLKFTIASSYELKI